MENDKYIEFSSPLPGTAVERLKVLYVDKGVLGLEKPAGVLIDAYPWYLGMGSIVGGLKHELLKGVHELEEYHLNSLYSVYSLEPEVTGVALVATEKESSSFLRNELGSGGFIFKFVLLAKSELKESCVECDLPLAKHHDEDTVLVSNKTGKKCKTVFSLMGRSGSYELWEARTDYVRMHQIRVHAMERGIRIVGEELYTEAESPRSSAFKGIVGKKLEKAPGKKLVICDGLCLHLSSVEWERDGKRVVVESALPRRMADVLELLE